MTSKKNADLVIRCRPLFISPTRLTIQTLQSQTRPRLSKQKVISCHTREAPVLAARYIVGVDEPPGAGKSTVASEVVRCLNMRWPERELMTNYMEKPAEIATIVPMDGFHIYRSQLDAMEDPKEAHARRGVSQHLTKSGNMGVLHALPLSGNNCLRDLSFDHGVGDPVEDDIFVNHRHKFVIVEGNYLLLDERV